jgi:nitrite transporter NirC
MLRKTVSGIFAGIMISIGGSVFLSCMGINKILAACLFSVALLCICLQGYSLYTGKIGFIVSDHSREAVSTLLLGLLGNVIATLVFGIALGYATPSIKDAAVMICEAKLDQELPAAFIRACFCGVLMYQAVSIFKNHNKNIVGILFCIPVFILSGFEHSIANMFYFSAAGIFSLDVVIYIFVVIAGNSMGAILFDLPSVFKKTQEKASDDKH